MWSTDRLVQIARRRPVAMQRDIGPLASVSELAVSYLFASEYEGPR